jgi:RNA polymerase sigma-70 factor, ECF subfamily
MRLGHAAKQGWHVRVAQKHIADTQKTCERRQKPAASSHMTADLLAVIPNLRAFAVSLCGNLDHADDLVQETLVKAWGSLDSFAEGTNLRAWLFTILRNIYYSEYRKRRREVADPDGAFAANLATAPAQSGHMDLLDFRAALQQLPSDQREALILIGASGLSYEEAAQICGCAIGTMKSRVNRARNRLAEMLSISSGEALSQDGSWRTVNTTALAQRYLRDESD